MIVEEILKIVDDEQIPVFGIGRASEMANELPGHSPGDLLPGAQSLICFGLPVSSAIYQMPNYRQETVWRSQNLNYRRLDTLSLQIASLLENHNEKACPIYGCMPMGVGTKGAVEGYLNQLRMGVVTKIGVIGKNGLLLNSRFGSRLMLGGVITSAVLPETHFPETNETGCPTDCHICVDACPVNAIVPGKRQVKVMRCLQYSARTPLMSRVKFVLLRAIDPMKAARYMSLTCFDEHTYHICSKCVALCPYGCN